MTRQNYNLQITTYGKVITFGLSLLMIVIVFAVFSIHAQQDREDILVFSVYTNVNQVTTNLISYDPNTGQSVVILETIFVYFRTSPDGQLVYQSTNDNGIDPALYVLESLSPDVNPINIMENPDRRTTNWTWSPDGSYLAFESSTATIGTSQILVWDGTDTINIMPHDDNGIREGVVSDITWSADGRYLAFVLHRNVSEIYTWDGQSIQLLTSDNAICAADCRDLAWSSDGRLVFTSGLDDSGNTSDVYVWDAGVFINVSQSPERFDFGAKWGPNDELAFLSTNLDRTEKDILVWDGISLNNDAPDTSSFTKATSGLEMYYRTFPTYNESFWWTEQGYLVFRGRTALNNALQVFLWDGQDTINMTPDIESNVQALIWSNDGLWAFATESGRLQVRDANNNMLLDTEGSFFTWSADGDLVFCKSNNDGGWSLNMWAGDTVTELATGRTIVAQWLSGQPISCIGQ